MDIGMGKKVDQPCGVHVTQQVPSCRRMLVLLSVLCAFFLEQGVPVINGTLIDIKDIDVC